MYKKTFFVFLILFSIILILGCVSSDSGTLGPSTTSNQIQKGAINATLSVNGKPITDVTLLGEQTALISMQIRNSGTVQMKNFETKIVGCLTSESTPAVKDINPGSSALLTWTLKAPQMGQGERINCPVIIRACYDYTTDGRVEIPVASEDYTDEINAPSAFTRSDVLSVTPQIGILKVVSSKGHNSYVGKLTITNIGPGWVDYLSYPTGQNLEVNKLKKVNLTLSGGLKFDSFFGFNSTKLRQACPSANGNDWCWLSNNDQTVVINAADTIADFDATVENSENYAYLLKLVGGKEITWNFNIGANEADYPDLRYEQLKYVIEHGYCTDIATINAKLSGT